MTLQKSYLETITYVYEKYTQEELWDNEDLGDF